MSTGRCWPIHHSGCLQTPPKCTYLLFWRFSYFISRSTSADCRRDPASRSWDSWRFPDTPPIYPTNR
ncbi:hypothetical protein M407DRAFT_200361 [Tulasnella calospora MUT 4182]|uniref:Uncharacterized protein n=1 Tax=Tulasnella calospora MUT 4182 TaxID=1051891 RepID=A0A0C3L2H6_9AGAM|nr:hypothetical protein M407DRAFT_200361 [Tulasnella calospora MUT 4182]